MVENRSRKCWTLIHCSFNYNLRIFPHLFIRFIKQPEFCFARIHCNCVPYGQLDAFKINAFDCFVWRLWMISNTIDTLDLKIHANSAFAIISIVFLLSVSCAVTNNCIFSRLFRIQNIIAKRCEILHSQNQLRDKTNISVQLNMDFMLLCYMIIWNTLALIVWLHLDSNR